MSEAGRVELVAKKLSDLNPAEYNPREIDEESYAGLGASISEFGLVEPIVYNVQTGNIVGGHQRFYYLQENGVKETDVVEVDLSLEKEKALNVTLNNPHIAGKYVSPKLQDLLFNFRDVTSEIANVETYVKLLNLDKLVEETSSAVEEASKSATQETPLPQPGPLEGSYQVVIDCADEAEQETIFMKIQELGIQCRMKTS